MNDFSFAAVLVLCLPDDAIASIPKRDASVLIRCFHEIPKTPHVEAALKRLSERVSVDDRAWRIERSPNAGSG